MTTATTTLADFLLARIAEEQSKAQQDIDDGLDLFEAGWPASRVLAECEAKRRIVESRAAISVPSKEIHDEVARQREYVWKLLALPYADHPDFRPEWRP